MERSRKTAPPKPPILAGFLAVLGGVPDADLLVLAAGGDLAVGGEGDAVDGGGVAGEGDKGFFLLDVEDLGRLVAAGGGQSFAVGAKGDVEHPVGVVFDREDGLAVFDVPDADGAVSAGGGDELVVGTEGDGEEGVRRFGQFTFEGGGAVGLGFPELNQAVLAGVATGGGEPLAVGAEGEVVDAFGGAGQAFLERTVGGLPLGELVVAGRRRRRCRRG